MVQIVNKQSLNMENYLQTSEEVAPIWIKSVPFALPTLYRSPFGYGDGGGRFYFHKDKPGFYSGYSHWTKQVLPTSNFLVDWKVNQGAERAELILRSSGCYGTLFHYVVSCHEQAVAAGAKRSDLLTMPESGHKYTVFSFEIDWWMDFAKEMASGEYLPPSVVEEWRGKLHHDMAGYLMFKQAHNVQVLGVEVPLSVDDFMVATPGDLVVAMTISEGQGRGKKKAEKRIIAGIDLKTGDKSAAYDGYRLQLLFMRYAWNQYAAGTDYEMTHVFNWRPKDRSSKYGGFVLTDQGGRMVDDEYVPYFSEQQLIHLGRTNRIMRYNEPTGAVKMYADNGSEDYTVQMVTPQQWLRRWQGIDLPQKEQTT